MNGAREYAQLFQTGQYGKLYIVSGQHPRGLTFHIQILPEGEMAIPNGSNNLCLNEAAVEVYGIISGQPGWTEGYGWLYLGKWVKDFKDLADEAIRKRGENAAKNEEQLTQKADARKQRIQFLLDDY